MRRFFDRDFLFTCCLVLPLVLGACLAQGCPAQGATFNPRTPYTDSSFEGGRAHAGEVLDCDLPESEHIKNIGSLIDGAGMCVMSSIEMAARYLNMDVRWRGLRDFCAREQGGGYPEKVVKQLAAYAKSKGLPDPTNQYLQYEGPDPWPIVEAALKSGRMACITYGTSPRYNQGSIAHMVCCVKAGSGQYAVVLDNNFPGEKNYEWMPNAELKRRINYPRRVGWVFVWLAPPPPPSPRNNVMGAIDVRNHYWCCSVPSSPLPDRVMGARPVARREDTEIRSVATV
jgi:hypothetical protein